MITGNKGEWSEPYALFKLLATQRLNLGKENYEILEDFFYPIVSFIRHERNKDVQFSYQDDLVHISTEEESFYIPIQTFVEYSELCLAKIREVRPVKDGAFAIPEIEDFLRSLKLDGLKSKSRNKHDITIQVKDSKSLFSPTLGFSIKSQLGRPSTLVNASNATNFTYILNGNLTDLQIQIINEAKKFEEKFRLIESFGCSLSFERIDSPVFEINLQTIDYNFPAVMADIVLQYHKNSVPKNNSIPYFTEQVTLRNPFGYRLELNPDIYKMMVKKFLVDYALGMRASEVWKRDYQASGGYLIVRQDGEVLCYHFYFTKLFENYLFDNSKLDTPDPKRYNTGKIFIEEGILKMKLNLQVRFNK